MKTKKVGSTGRFGARYGRKNRQRVLEVERKLKAFHKCPYCTKKRVKRIALGIWQCRACLSKLTGNAYTLR